MTDYLRAADNWAELSDGAVSFFYRTLGFDYVKPISTTPTGDIKTQAAVDYALDLSEFFWQDP
ncbi:MAG: hypothetical protein A2V98_12595 [Planctomycetes bacterium RBG_16_64_12]|nr:MAG: hypothetical protein A2V98_12595 [Planctomycetes bacterium RBG_16_64_12]